MATKRHADAGTLDNELFEEQIDVVGPQERLSKPLDVLAVDELGDDSALPMAQFYEVALASATDVQYVGAEFVHFLMDQRDEVITFVT